MTTEPTDRLLAARRVEHVLTPAQKAAIVENLPSDPRDFFTDEERKELNEALKRLAECRRRAEAESAHLVMCR